MADNNEFIPELTLNPTGETAAAAVQAEQANKEERDANAVKLDMSNLSENERKAVMDFAEKIDITDTNAVLQYGSAAQKHISDFSSNTLNSVRTKDMGEVGDMLSDLVVELKGFNYGEEEKKGFFGKKKK